MATYYYVVMTRAKAGMEEEFHRWYDEQHLPDCVKVPGVVSAKRYKVDSEVGPSSEGSKVLKAGFDSIAIYVMETEDPVAVARELSARAGSPDMVMTDTIDPTAMVKYITTEAGAWPQ